MMVILADPDLQYQRKAEEIIIEAKWVHRDKGVPAHRTVPTYRKRREISFSEGGRICLKDQNTDSYNICRKKILKKQDLLLEDVR
jgi:hypothetical protein